MGNLDKRTSRWKCQSTNPVSFISETSCLCTRKARSMASSALWGKLRVSHFSARWALHMEEMSRLLTFTVPHWCTFFHANVLTTGGSGLTRTSCGQGPSARKNAALQEIVRKCNRNAKRRYTSKYVSFRSRPGPPRGSTGMLVMAL